MSLSPDVYRFRLISCHTCGWRIWASEVNGEVRDYRGIHEHDDLWEDHTFMADNRNGPGQALVATV